MRNTLCEILLYNYILFIDNYNLSMISNLINYNFINHEYNPNIIIVDASQSSVNGFKKAFNNDNIIRVMCFFHMKKSIKDSEHFSQINKVDQQLILNDIDLIQISTNKQQFEKGNELFKTKWSNNEFVTVVIQ